MTVAQLIHDFLAGAPHAVVGASTDRAKYGNKALRCYLQHDRPVYVVHPSAQTIEGQPCYRSLAALPEVPHGVSVITPPTVSARIVSDAAAAGIRRLWFQPGAESPAVLALAAEHRLQVIAGGPCLLVTLGYHEDD